MRCLWKDTHRTQYEQERAALRAAVGKHNKTHVRKLAHYAATTGLRTHTVKAFTSGRLRGMSRLGHGPRQMLPPEILSIVCQGDQAEQKCSTGASGHLAASVFRVWVLRSLPEPRRQALRHIGSTAHRQKLSEHLEMKQDQQQRWQDVVLAAAAGSALPRPASGFGQKVLQGLQQNLEGFHQSACASRARQVCLFVLTSYCQTLRTPKHKSLPISTSHPTSAAAGP